MAPKLPLLPFAALLTSAALPALAADQPAGQRALDVLRQMRSDPATTAQRFKAPADMMTTGSVIRSKGVNRVLYHLPALDRPLRLEGERDERNWTVQVARQQLSGPVSFRLGYKNAVSVMPEASHLELEINGKRIGRHAIRSAVRTRTLTMDVPPSLLLPGPNTVRLIARQRHRVDCSIDATHELWTDIDAASTGFVFSVGNSTLSSLDALGALARNKAGQVRMNVLVPEGLDARAVERSVKLAQRVAVHAGFKHPIIDVSSTGGTGPGIDIHAGNRASLAAIAPNWSDQLNMNEPVQVLARDGQERLAVVMLDDGTDAPDEFAARLERAFANVGRPAQLMDDNANDRLLTGLPVRFSDLGLRSEEFDGRLYRNGFDVTLPADYFSADYDRAELNLATGYGAGLDHTNRLIVRVNGRTVTGLALSRAGGHVFRDKMVRMPLSNFRPGRNRIEIEARLSAPSDEACDPRRQIEDEKRFIISGKSTIRLPPLAHLARFPDLGLTMTAGFPYIAEGKAEKVVLAVAQPDRSSLSAAATVATHIALSAGTPLDFVLRYGPPAEDTRHAIVLGPYAMLPPKLSIGMPGIDATSFRTAWALPDDWQPNRAFVGTPVTPRNLRVVGTDGQAIDTAMTASIDDQRDILDGALPALEEARDDRMFDRWSKGETETTKRDEGRIDLSGQLLKLARSLFAEPADAQRSGTEPLTDTRARLLLHQRRAPEAADGVWTVLTARDAAALHSGANLLARPAIAARLAGETAAINGIDHTVTSTITTSQYVMLRDTSPGNLKRIAAGWFSNNHFVFSGLFLLTLFGIAGVSSLVLRRSGVSQGENTRRG